ncbi:hypothetical protein I0E98_10545 [Pseudomonas lalucatii]|nr:hypothetical protein [Pseudomonas lalucatii]
MTSAGFEYHTEFTPLLYHTHVKGFSIFKSEEPTLEPDIQAYLQDPERRALLDRLGRDRWELVSVQPVKRGEIKIGNQNAQGWAYGIALPTGYLLFFKRPLCSD